MAVTDRWHKTYPDPKADTPCKCGTAKRPMYPTAEHPRPAEPGKRAKSGGKRWQVRYRDENDKQTSRNFHLKEGKNSAIHAEAFDAEVNSQLNAGTYIDPSAGEITVAKWAAEWRANQPVGKFKSDTTRDEKLAYIYDVPRPAGKRKSTRRGAGQTSPIAAKELAYLVKHPSAIQGWIKWMEGLGLAPNTINQIINLLSLVLSAAVDDAKISRNPLDAKSIRRPRAAPKSPVVPWTLTQIQTGADYLASQSERMESVIYTGAGAGLRLSEALALSKGDLEFLGGRTVHVQRQIKAVLNPETRRHVLVFGLPKRDKIRTVPLSDFLGQVLAAHIKEFSPVRVTLPWETWNGQPHTAELLYVTADGRPWLGQNFSQNLWVDVRKAAGVPVTRENGFHAMRHTFASATLANGVDIGTLADYLGHSNPATTLRYYRHLMPDAADKARDAINVFFKDAETPSALDVPASRRG